MNGLVGRVRAHAPLLAVLALSLGLGAWGLGYGLPNIYSWAQDEVIPAEVLEGLERRFAGGWYSRYPPLHYGLMAGAYAPVLLFSPPPAVSYDSVTYHRLFLAGRLLSLLMAAGTLMALYACGRQLIGARAGAFAALCLAMSPTFAYYSKFANLDVPYLFWFAVSLRFLLRFLRDYAQRDAVLAAFAAALALSTKDQAYALYVLPALAVPFALRRARAREGEDSRLPAVVRDRRLVLPALTALLVFALAHNLAFNPSGFLEHVRLVTGDASRDYRMFPPGPGGQLSLLRLSVRLLLFVLGEPAALLALLGLLIAWRVRERRLLFALLPLLSLQLAFLGVVGYAYDRFLLPHALVLSLFAGRAFEALAGWGRAGPWLRRLSVAAVLGYGVLRIVSLDLLLGRDSRYVVEAWFRRNVRQDARVALLGPYEYLPRPGGPYWKQRSELVRAVQSMDPDCVVINADFAQRAEDEHARELYAQLATPQLGFLIAFGVRSTIPWPFRIDEYVRRRGALLPSNLDKLNPEIRVYARADQSRRPSKPPGE